MHQLKRFAQIQSRSRFRDSCSVSVEFIDNDWRPIEAIIKARMLEMPFDFIFLDPKGWADIPMIKGYNLSLTRSQLRSSYNFHDSAYYSISR